MVDRQPSFFEIDALVDAIGKALGLPGKMVARAIERNEISVDMTTDSQGRHCLKVAYLGQSGYVYPDAIPQVPGRGA